MTAKKYQDRAKQMSDDDTTEDVKNGRRSPRMPVADVPPDGVWWDDSKNRFSFTAGTWAGTVLWDRVAALIKNPATSNNRAGALATEDDLSYLPAGVIDVIFDDLIEQPEGEPFWFRDEGKEELCFHVGDWLGILRLPVITAMIYTPNVAGSNAGLIMMRNQTVYVPDFIIKGALHYLHPAPDPDEDEGKTQKAPKGGSKRRTSSSKGK